MSPLDYQIRFAIDQNPHLLGRKVRIETHDGRVTLEAWSARSIKSRWPKRRYETSPG